MADVVAVTCPSCFEEFDVPAPGFDEVPCEVDYDCEVCCRPMLIRFTPWDDTIAAEAVGLGD